MKKDIVMGLRHKYDSAEKSAPKACGVLPNPSSCHHSAGLRTGKFNQARSNLQSNRCSQPDSHENPTYSNLIQANPTKSRHFETFLFSIKQAGASPVLEYHDPAVAFYEN
jgi:hypothetical protein